MIADANLDLTAELNLSYYTHEKNTLSAAAGLATLSVIIDENWGRAALLGKLVEESLHRGIRDAPTVTDIRCAGLMVAIDFEGTAGGQTGEQLALRARSDLLRQQLLPMPAKGKTLSFSIPLIIPEKELELALNLIVDTVKEAQFTAGSSDPPPVSWTQKVGTIRVPGWAAAP